VKARGEERTVAHGKILLNFPSIRRSSSTPLFTAGALFYRAGVQGRGGEDTGAVVRYSKTRRDRAERLRRSTEPVAERFLSAALIPALPLR
jgi:hypothetical protein